MPVGDDAPCCAAKAPCTPRCRHWREHRAAAAKPLPGCHRCCRKPCVQTRRKVAVAERAQRRKAAEMGCAPATASASTLPRTARMVSQRCSTRVGCPTNSVPLAAGVGASRLALNRPRCCRGIALLCAGRKRGRGDAEAPPEPQGGGGDPHCEPRRRAPALDHDGGADQEVRGAHVVREPCSLRRRPPRVRHASQAHAGLVGRTPTSPLFGPASLGVSQLCSIARSAVKQVDGTVSSSCLNSIPGGLPGSANEAEAGLPSLPRLSRCLCGRRRTT